MNIDDKTFMAVTGTLFSAVGGIAIYMFKELVKNQEHNSEKIDKVKDILTEGIKNDAVYKLRFEQLDAKHLFTDLEIKDLKKNIQEHNSRITKIEDKS